jgi:hypothetical protein
LPYSRFASHNDHHISDIKMLKSFPSISPTTTGSVPVDWRKSSSSMSGMAMETRTSWPGAGGSRDKEEHGTSGLEKMKVEVRVWNRKVEDMRMELVQMRVETSLAWSDVDNRKEFELGKELEMMKEEVNSTH